MKILTVLLFGFVLVSAHARAEVEGYHCSYRFELKEQNMVDTGWLLALFPKASPKNPNKFLPGSVFVASKMSHANGTLVSNTKEVPQNFKVRSVEQDSREIEYLNFFLEAQDNRRTPLAKACNVHDGYGHCVDHWSSNIHYVPYCDPIGGWSNIGCIDTFPYYALDSRIGHWILRVNSANPADAWLIRLPRTKKDPRVVQTRAYCEIYPKL